MGVAESLRLAYKYFESSFHNENIVFPEAHGSYTRYN